MLTVPDLGSQVIPRLTRRLVPFLFVLYIIAYLDRINVGFAALQMQQQLHFNDAVYGLGAGMFFAGYLFFQLPSNLILNKVGARRWICFLMVVWGFISCGMVFVTSVKSFYALRFCLGLAEAGFFPGVILYLRNWFPANVRARTVALFMTAAPLAGVVGGPVSGALLTLHNRGGLAGWQWLFLVEGLPAILMGAIVVFYLTDTPAKAEWLSVDQRQWLIDTLELERQNTTTSGYVTAGAALSSGRVWMLTFMYFGMNTCTYGISLWLPTVIHSLSGVSSVVIGFLSAIPYIAAAIAMVIVGYHSDRTRERRWHAAIPAFVAMAGLLAAAYSHSVVPMIAAISIAYLAEFSMMGPFWSIPTTFLAGTGAAAGIALINSIGNLGGFFGPYIIGLVRNQSGSFKGGLMVVAAAMAFAGCIASVIKLDPPPSR
ncbi:MAG TPA: MFS transporter [Terriglobales bacterium]|jgi:ACS family tartrate transporter-like MFS transporter|nr:MFS transporter [Terriglobales bacterium]